MIKTQMNCLDTGFKMVVPGDLAAQEGGKDVEQFGFDVIIDLV